MNSVAANCGTNAPQGGQMGDGSENGAEMKKPGECQTGGSCSGNAAPAA